MIFKGKWRIGQRGNTGNLKSLCSWNRAALLYFQLFILLDVILKINV